MAPNSPAACYGSAVHDGYWIMLLNGTGLCCRSRMGTHLALPVIVHRIGELPALLGGRGSGHGGARYGWVRIWGPNSRLIIPCL